MEYPNSLPFKIGDVIEVKSFVDGYRGAWFRCKIVDLRVNEGVYEHAVEYIDFPGEKILWEKLYEVPYHIPGKSREKHKELMLRPSYPPILSKEQIDQDDTISEVSVIVEGKWKVGDLLDWLTDNSFWTGHITAMLSHEKAKFELLRPPVGEGSVYDIFLKDVRPALHWSPEHGWQLPSQRKGRATCASLLKPISEVTSRHRGKRARLETDVPAEAISSNSVANSDHAKAEECPGPEDSQEATKAVPGECTSMTSGHVETEVRATEEGTNICPFDGSKLDKRLTLRSSECASAEAAVIDLQRCLNRVKFLRALALNNDSSLVDSRPRWKFILPSYPTDE